MKNSKQAWEATGYRINKRKRAGTASVVYIGGEKVPESKIQKELSRHYLSTTQILNQGECKV
jgi:hypothetical protein